MKKKLVSLTVTGLMLLSSVTAFANPTTESMQENTQNIENQVQPRGGYSNFKTGDRCYIYKGGELRSYPGNFNNYLVYGNVRRFDLCVFETDSYTPEDGNYWAYVRMLTGECEGQSGWVRLDDIRLDY